jgi:hypothetical protein
MKKKLLIGLLAFSLVSQNQTQAMSVASVLSAITPGFLQPSYWKRSGQYPIVLAFCATAGYAIYHLTSKCVSAGSSALKSAKPESNSEKEKIDLSKRNERQDSQGKALNPILNSKKLKNGVTQKNYKDKIILTLNRVDSEPLDVNATEETINIAADQMAKDNPSGCVTQ